MPFDSVSRMEPLAGPAVAFGTAHLFGTGPDEASSRELLRTAYDRGCRAFDTAPSYGRGRSEAELGTFLAAVADGAEAHRTTKVGLAPILGRPGLRKVAVATARRLLPSSVVDRLRRSAAEAVQGHFGPEEVRTSVQRSLARLGVVDRLMLHEVRPQDLTDELLAVLRDLLLEGSVRAIGVATRNHLTAEVVRSAPDLFTVAHIAVGPLADQVVLPSGVQRVGHGLLGDGGRELVALQAELNRSPKLAERWRAAVAGTEWEGSDGLARALLGRASVLGLHGVVVATSSPERVASSLATPRRRPAAEVLDVVHALTTLAEHRLRAETPEG